MGLFESNRPNKLTTSRFLVPTFYSKFKCKGSDCRNTCCHGWTVTVSQKEYFVLHGVSTNKTLRDKIDRAFIPFTNPTSSRYAEIRHNYDGDCPLLAKNGFCSLHSSLGEKVLPSVCRYYPRGPRNTYGYESTVTNSCEKTLELLFEDTSPISFEEKDLSFEMVLPNKRENQDEINLYQLTKNQCFRILSNRLYSLPHRIHMVGILLQKLDLKESINLEEIYATSFQGLLTLDSIQTMIEISKWFIDRNSSLSDYFETILKEYHDQDPLAYYQVKQRNFHQNLVDHEVMYEKMLINNLYFRQFPFQEYTINFNEEYISLVAKYMMIRFLGVHLYDGEKLENFVDVMAKSFRVIAHTKFEKTMIQLLKQLHADSQEALANGLML
ncbi:MAG: flagellin lysine-N-methylase [Candidatus Izemoplasmatales bacterium]